MHLDLRPFCTYWLTFYANDPSPRKGQSLGKSRLLLTRDTGTFPAFCGWNSSGQWSFCSALYLFSFPCMSVQPWRPKHEVTHIRLCSSWSVLWPVSICQQSPSTWLWSLAFLTEEFDRNFLEQLIYYGSQRRILRNDCLPFRFRPSMTSESHLDALFRNKNKRIRNRRGKCKTVLSISSGLRAKKKQVLNSIPVCSLLPKRNIMIQRSIYWLNDSLFKVSWHNCLWKKAETKTGKSDAMHQWMMITRLLVCLVFQCQAAK